MSRSSKRLCTISLLVLSLLLFSGGGGANSLEPPLVTDSYIIFKNGHRIDLVNKTYETASDETKQKADTILRLSQYARLVKTWERVYLITLSYYFEGISKSIVGYDYDGNKIFEESRLFGDILFLEPTKRLLLAHTDIRYQSSGSRLLSINGELIRQIDSSDNADFVDAASDGRLFWLISGGGTIQAPANQVDIYDSEGDLVAQLSLYIETAISILFQEHTYHIKVRAPRVPG